MNRVVKLNLLIFLFVTLLTVVFNMINYVSGSGSFFNIYVIFIVLFFNASIGILAILLINKLVKISEKGYRVFLFYLVLSFFIYVYVVSVILHFYYGSFRCLNIVFINDLWYHNNVSGKTNGELNVIQKSS